MNSKKSERQASQPPSLSSFKRNVFRAITLVFPVFVLVLLELTLRVFHYGPDLSLFTVEEVGGTTYYIMNPEVKNRYFSHVEFSPNTSLDYFRVPKPNGAFRIFCLGGSTTVGFPYGYVGAFSSFLRDRLRAVLPQRNIEIINLGMTATNSFTVNDIVHELVDYEPDLIIVYDGHNEFYGALGAASRESFGASRWLTVLYLKCIHYKTFLLLRSAFTKTMSIFSSSSSPAPGGTMMERLARDNYIPRNSSLYRNCFENFKANIQELASVCRSYNTPVILSTQVSNVRDLPPFISITSEYATSREKEFKVLFERGKHLLNLRHYDSARTVLISAISIDSERADVHYALAQCLDSMNLKHDALTEYLAARDYDQLRFRASSDFNNAIRDMRDSSRTMVADIEAIFLHASTDSLIGNELILEHLHPTLRGNFLIAKALTELLRRHQLIASQEEWNKVNNISDDSMWSHRPTTAIDELAARRRISVLTSSWPFQSGTTVLPSPPIRDSLGIIVDRLVKAKTTWEEAHVAAAEYYARHGDTVQAEQEYRTLINQLPMNVSAYLFLGRLYMLSGKYEEAENILQHSLEIEKTVFACRAIGGIKLNAGQAMQAILWLEQAVALSTEPEEQMENGYLFSVALVKAGMRDRAKDIMQRLLQKFPDFKPGSALLREITSGAKSR